MLSTSASAVVIAALIAISVSAAYAYTHRDEHKSHNRRRSVMKRSMGGFLMILALPKLLNIRSFAGAFGRYDIIAFAAPAYAYIYPFLEMGLGAAWWHTADASESDNTRLMAVYATTLVLMAVSLIGVLRALAVASKPLVCGCLGTLIHLPLSLVTVVESAGMILMTAYLLSTLDTTPVDDTDNKRYDGHATGTEKS